ncbi:MAG: hypothetical protein MJE12_29065 [Alphaproteobacteria bacterium]|nr:hypothetical protein [Alphaproteobacteria bacterium]
MEQTVLSTRPTSKPGRGIVVFKREIKNQDDTVIQEMEATIMYRCREKE